jgi:hypothetical protein
MFSKYFWVSEFKKKSRRFQFKKEKENMKMTCGKLGIELVGICECRDER